MGNKRVDKFGKAVLNIVILHESHVAAVNHVEDGRATWSGRSRRCFRRAIW